MKKQLIRNALLSATLILLAVFSAGAQIVIPTDSICSGDSLLVTTSDTSSNSRYEWNISNGSPGYWIGKNLPGKVAFYSNVYTGRIDLRITDTITNVVRFYTQNLWIFSGKSNVYLANTDLGCGNTPVTLTPTGASSFIWTQNGIAFDTSASITVTSPGGGYEVYGYTQYASNFGCKSQWGQKFDVNTPNPPKNVQMFAQSSKFVTSFPENGILNACYDGGGIILGVNYSSYGPMMISIVWEDGSNAPNRTVTVGGNYKVTVTDQNGCGMSDSVLLVINNPIIPVITASGPLTFCSGNNKNVILSDSSGTFTNHQWISNGNWGQSAPTITVWNSGDFYLSATDSNGCQSISAPVTVKAKQSPTQQSIMALGCVLGSYSVYDSTLSYSWTLNGIPTGVTGLYDTVSVSGFYSLGVTSSNGCTSWSSLYQFQNWMNATITATDTSLCQGQSAMLTASPSPADSYLWSTGETTDQISVNSSGVVSVDISWLGCKLKGNVNITVNPLPSPAITTSGLTTFCDGGSVTLSGATQNSYAWNTGEITDVIKVTESGNYSAVVTSPQGCTTVSDSVFVTVNPTPPIPTISTNGCAQTSSAYMGNQWYLNGSPLAGQQGNQLYSSVSGSYSVSVTNGLGCTSYSSMNSFLPPPAPIISANGPTTFCQGGTVTLTSTTASSYLWSNGATTQVIAVSSSGAYTVTGTYQGCSLSSVPVTVTINPSPLGIISANGPTTFCDGGDVTLAGSVSSDTYAWSDGQVGPSILAIKSGIYSAVVTTPLGCIANSNAIAVTVNSLPKTNFTVNGPNLVAPYGTGYQYQWFFLGYPISGANKQFLDVTPSGTGSYRVHIINSFTCDSMSIDKWVTYSATGIVTIGRDSKISIYPNPFMDEVNIEMPGEKFTATLLNMMGQVVFQHTTRDRTTISREKLSAGIYFLQIQQENKKPLVAKLQAM